MCPNIRRDHATLDAIFTPFPLDPKGFDCKVDYKLNYKLSIDTKNARKFDRERGVAKWALATLRVPLSWNGC